MMTAGVMDVAPMVARGWTYALAAARVLPCVILVPTLAVRGLPVQFRLCLCLALGVAMTPQIAEFSSTPPEVPATVLSACVQLARQLLHGLPWAIVTAGPLWVSTHLGAMADQLRGGAGEATTLPGVENGSVLAVLSGLLASLVWLQGGGMVRMLLLLSSAPGGATDGGVLALRSLLQSLRTGLLLATMVVIPVLSFEVLVASVTRLAAPFSPQPMVVVARPLVVLLSYMVALQAAASVVGALPSGP